MTRRELQVSGITEMIVTSLMLVPCLPVLANSSEEITETRLLLGTYVSITVDLESAPRQYTTILDKAFMEIKRLEDALSTYKPYHTCPKSVSVLDSIWFTSAKQSLDQDCLRFTKCLFHGLIETETAQLWPLETSPCSWTALRRRWQTWFSLSGSNPSKIAYCSHFSNLISGNPTVLGQQ